MDFICLKWRPLYRYPLLQLPAVFCSTEGREQLLALNQVLSRFCSRATAKLGLVFSGSRGLKEKKKKKRQICWGTLSPNRAQRRTLASAGVAVVQFPGQCCEAASSLPSLALPTCPDVLGVSFSQVADPGFWGCAWRLHPKQRRDWHRWHITDARAGSVA